MTDVCTLKKSNLVFPSTYYELDREEMSYVDGGAITRYTGWSAIYACTSVLCFGTVAKIGTQKVSNFVKMIKGFVDSIIHTTTKGVISNLLSGLGLILNIFSVFKFFLFGTALVSSIYNMVNYNSCTVDIFSLFGLAISPTYIGV